MTGDQQVTGHVGCGKAWGAIQSMRNICSSLFIPSCFVLGHVMFFVGYVAGVSWVKHQTLGSDSEAIHTWLGSPEVASLYLGDHPREFLVSHHS